MNQCPRQSKLLAPSNEKNPLQWFLDKKITDNSLEDTYYRACFKVVIGQFKLQLVPFFNVNSCKPYAQIFKLISFETTTADTYNTCNKKKNFSTFLPLPRNK